MRRWFQTPQWICRNPYCQAKLSASSVLVGGTLYVDGNAECSNCTKAERTLKAFLRSRHERLMRSNITA